MYRQLGSSAFVFVLFSALASGIGGGHALQADKGRLEGEAPTKSTNPKSESTNSQPEQCSVAEVLREHAGDSVKPEVVTAVNSAGTNQDFCGQAIQSLAPGLEVSGRVLIATVPNPLQSANLLEFDRDIEALQEAAVTSGYNFESMITDWHLSDLEEPKDFKTGREAQAYRKLFGDKPGAMLFHRANSATSFNDLLLIILVPESPTYGLNMRAAKIALQAVDALKAIHIGGGAEGKTDEIDWIGPNYSSSAAGLKNIAESQSRKMNAYSGSITSWRALEILADLDGKKPSEVSSLASDTKSLRALLKTAVLSDEERKSVAILQEDESTYGAEHTADEPDADVPQDTRGKIRTFKFPRGVSHVRSVFGSELTNFKPSSGDAANTRKSKSVFALDDTLQEPLDTSPEFAAQSPFSSEGVLAAISSSLEHAHTAVIVILATDPLDQLFLTRYFHNKLPNVRLVLLNAERLLPDLRGQYDMDGTISISRFPLFEDSYLSVPSEGESRHALTFMNSTQEGVFFAALHQIGTNVDLVSASPDQDGEMPIWIGVSSGGSLWPLSRSGIAQSAANHAAARYVVTDIPNEPLPELWLIVTSIALCCVAVHIAFALLAGPLNSKLLQSKLEWKRHFADSRILTFYLPGKLDAAHDSYTRYWDWEFGRQYWLFNATSWLLLIIVYLLLPGVVFVGHSEDNQGFLHAFGNFLKIADVDVLSGFGAFSSFVSFAIAAVFVWLGVKLVIFWREAPQAMPRLRKAGYILWPVGTALWTAASLVFVWRAVSDEQNGWLFSVRGVHLASGACPVLPLLLASLGFLVAGIVNLNALALARDRNPEMPVVGPNMIEVARFESHLMTYIERWGLLPNPQGLILFAYVLLACLILHPIQVFGSFEGYWMTHVYALTFVLGLWMIAWLWVRFFSIWNHLRLFLEALEGSPLRFAFSRLPKVFSLVPIWSYSGLRRSLLLPMRWLEYLRVAPDAGDQAKRQQNEADLVRKISLSLFESRTLMEGSYIEFCRDQNAYASELSQQKYVLDSWAQGGRDAEVTGASGKQSRGKDDSGVSDCRDDIPVPCGRDITKNCEAALANEYIAMRFGAYIRYVTLQLKNLMTFMSIGLLLLLLAAISYPFHEPQTIAWALILVVVILLAGLGTVLMQMDRDAILSRLSETQPGKVDRSAFLWHMVSVGGLPVITAVAAIFPSIGSFLFSWLRPLLSALH